MRTRSTVPIAKPSSSDNNRARAMRRSKRVTPERVGQQAAILFAYGTLRRGAPMHGLIEGRTDWPRGGRSIYFRDPDGHLGELATPGIWPIY